jgi:hypothetical protein
MPHSPIRSWFGVGGFTKMLSKWMVALIAATALVPAAANAQDGRGRPGRGMENGERAGRPDRGARGFDRPAFREAGQAPARPAGDGGMRVRREGFGQRGEGGRPAFRGGEARPDRPAVAQGWNGRREWRGERAPGGEGARPDFGGVRGARPDRQATAQAWNGRRERPAFEQRGDRTPGRDGGRPGFNGDRQQRFGGLRERRGDERLLDRGPAGREQFSRERQIANGRLGARGDIRTGRQGSYGNGERRWYGDNGWGQRGGDWNRGNGYRGGFDRGNYARGGWDRNWRRDGRYDWRGYRTTNRSLYRLPRYYAPQGYYGGYRRFGIGFTLSSILFAPDYWIDDPWSYRLPDADGPYRWVRYYNDALLVDMETGEVVDVEYDMFW